MSSMKPAEQPDVKRMIEGLKEAVGDRLSSVVLYGSAARGDFQRRTSDVNLLIVLADVEPETLERLTDPLAMWIRRGQPLPRLFSASLIADAADVFPIEFLDIKHSRIVLYGSDPFETLEVRRDNLRLQCERELREKMMRLREGYSVSHWSTRELRRLLTDSYTTFVALFRGCLWLLDDEIPAHNEEVVSAFCERAGLDPAPFREVDRLKRGESEVADPKKLFSRYYAELTRAVRTVDRFGVADGGKAT